MSRVGSESASDNGVSALRNKATNYFSEGQRLEERGDVVCAGFAYEDAARCFGKLEARTSEGYALQLKICNAGIAAAQAAMRMRP